MIKEIITVANWLKENFAQTDEIKAYVFGSAMYPDKIPNDIDILIIYNDPNHPKEIRDILDDFGYIPIHLIFLTLEEEVETNFIKSQNCRSIL